MQVLQLHHLVEHTLGVMMVLQETNKTYGPAKPRRCAGKKFDKESVLFSCLLSAKIIFGKIPLKSIRISEASCFPVPKPPKMLWRGMAFCLSAIMKTFLDAVLISSTPVISRSGSDCHRISSDSLAKDSNFTNSSSPSVWFSDCSGSSCTSAATS